MSKPLDEEVKIIVGQFASVYGIKGWIRVHSFTEPKPNIFQYLPWWMSQEKVVETLEKKPAEEYDWQKIEFIDYKIQGEDLIVKFSGCDDRDEVRFYTNRLIAVARDLLPKLSTDEFYWSDLIGLEVLTEQGQVLGHVDHLLATGANDVLVLQGERQRLLPYTFQVIKSIDFEKKTIIVDWDPDF